MMIEKKTLWSIRNSRYILPRKETKGFICLKSDAIRQKGCFSLRGTAWLKSMGVVEGDPWNSSLGPYLGDLIACLRSWILFYMWGIISRLLSRGMTCSRLYVRDSFPELLGEWMGRGDTEHSKAYQGSRRSLSAKGQQRLKWKGENIYTISGWVRDEREVSSMVPGCQLRSLGGALVNNWKWRQGSG